MRRVLLLSAICILTAGAASGCIRYYKLDVQQGNVLDAASVAQVEPGMTRRQVRYLLGTPLVQDPFHPQRWDYYYSFSEGGERTTARMRVTIYFDGDTVTRVERQGLESAAAEPAPVEASPESPKPGWLRRLWKRLRR